MRAVLVGMGLFGLVLAACSPVYDTVYSYEAPASGEGKLCANQCGQIEQLCKRNCLLEHDSCLAEQREQAQWDYKDYVRRQQERKEPVSRDPDDFNLDYRCADSTVSTCQATCGSDQRSCYATCGGHVSATRVCTAFCDQK